ncbi:peptidase M14 [Pontibacillus halophilus JSM 076056 = DSM 19796]|uniref:Peptidase M14 n=1 Tax=Pontibacillus halophilus JSM 076056 = DSM 19796 TaxID=1385510 RepID=A0A0A5GPJ8_9BACI|nr:M14 family metallocarboxypeptidase [Pontibacillus halophilus]KGX93909.1 peptidase M14 [Pontibacillus halophilus JSM 076056 = DSM 19796]
MRKAVAWLIILMMIVPTSMISANSPEYVTLELLEDVPLKHENWGTMTLLKGTTIYGQAENDGYLVQYYNDHVDLNNEMVKVVETGVTDDYAQYEEQTYLQEVVSEKQVIVSKSGEELGHIASQEELYYVEGNRNTIQIGNKMFHVKPDESASNEGTSGKQAEESGSEEASETKGSSTPEKPSSTEDSNVEEAPNTNQQKTVVEEEQEGEPSKEVSVADASNVQSEDVSASAAPEVNSTEVTFEETDVFEVTSSYINVYVRENGSLTSVGRLEQGEIFERTADYGSWHKLRVGNQTAYVWAPATKAVANEGALSTTNTVGNREVLIVEDAPIFATSNPKSDLYVGILSKGTEVTYLSKESGMYKVNVGNREVYLEEEYITEPFVNSDAYFKVNQDNVGLYERTGEGLVAIGQLENGEVYQRVASYGSWHKVKVGSKVAFVWARATSPVEKPNVPFTNEAGSLKATLVSDASVYDNSSGSLEYIGELQEGTEMSYISKFGNWYKVNFNNRTAYIYGSAVKTSFTKADSYFRVDTDNVTLYESDGGQLTSIGKLSKGQVYERLGQTGGWHRVRVGNDIGYVWASATSPASGGTNSYISNVGSLQGELVSDVTVYDNSSGKLVEIGVLYKGMELAYLEKVGSWYKVNFNNRVGYVYKSGVKENFAGDYFRVTNNHTTLYKRENGSLKEVGQLQNNTVYKRVADYGSWHKIRIGKTTGYIWENATEPSSKADMRSEQQQKSTGIRFSINQDVTVYDNSSGSLKPIGTLWSGEQYNMVSTSGAWVEVDYLNKKGYIYKPALSIQSIDLVNPNKTYSYQQMRTDLYELRNSYPDLVELITIGKSEDGRELFALKLGKGKEEVMFNGSHHAREHMTTNVLMEMIDQYASSYTKNQSFDGYPTRTILNETSMWFVPMLNPDGVTLVQQGYRSANNSSAVLALNGFSYDFSSWKANINGVDLNRQYPADWANIRNNASGPTYKNYKGRAPLTESEARALYDFTYQHDFQTTVAYHSSGEIIYWYFNQPSSTYSRDLRLANQVSDITGYSLVAAKPNPSGGGYTDWFVQDKRLPGLTIEISPYTYEQPVPQKYWSRIWRQNRSIGLFIAEEVTER